jgi:hypothetical protein
VARIIADRLPEKFGQRAVIDNRGILAPELAAALKSEIARWDNLIKEKKRREQQ